jgi:hypothetical protein
MTPTNTVANSKFGPEQSQRLAVTFVEGNELGATGLDDGDLLAVLAFPDLRRCSDVLVALQRRHLMEALPVVVGRNVAHEKGSRVTRTVPPRRARNGGQQM